MDGNRRTVEEKGERGERDGREEQKADLTAYLDHCERPMDSLMLHEENPMKMSITQSCHPINTLEDDAI